jgi:release factor glutamine methyltransferase
MYVKEKYNNIIERLLPIYHTTEAQNIANILLLHRLQTNSLSMIVNDTIPTTVLNQLQQDEQLLLQHKPLQYVLEEAWFYKYPFYVNEAVLIPRPETELLVEQCINEANKYNNPVQIIDIGTGSGCIAISVKLALPNSNVTAVDISAAALAVAQKNATNLKATIDFKSLNVLDKNDWNILPQATIIVSNPPYIPLSQKLEMNQNVLEYEPHLALFVPNEEPLLFYKSLAQLSVLHNATLCCEISEYYGKETVDLFNQYFTHVQLYKDYEGKDRFIVAQL